MKILSISDVVVPELERPSARREFPGIDLVLACGDLPPEYLESVMNIMDVPLYYVLGNHDIRFDSRLPVGCRNIHGRIIEHGNVRILGLGGSRWYNGGPNQYTEKQMQALIRKQRLALWWNGGVDIVITHASPRHIHDREDRCHRGFSCFRTFIDTYRPRLFIHGHIHQTFDHPHDRVSVIGSTEVINAYGYTITQVDFQHPD